jgi:opacity protein-like surface antigen
MRAHALAVSLLALALPITAAAQTPVPEGPPRIPATPDFHVTVGLAHATWSGTGLTGATGPTVGITRHVIGPMRVAFDFASLSGNTFSGSGVESAHHYLIDAGVTLAPTFRAGERIVQPHLGLAIGTLVTDPANATSSTRSQNDWELVAGLDVGITGPFTLGAGYRRVSVSLQDAAATGPTAASTAVTANVFAVRVGVRF